MFVGQQENAELNQKGMEPLLPGVEGVLTAIATPDESVQRRGLELLYTKGMLQDPQTKEEAKRLFIERINYKPRKGFHLFVKTPGCL